MSDHSEREQVTRIFEELSPPAQQLIVEVLRIERENLHLSTPPRIADQIVKKVEGIIK
jgi:hypothetical protein